ncbi:hypothetical protein [Frigidibacter mobilis]|uniref:hypothetical protein n=1 Tax=Frigidibacter mobilis TaxID=1335048 RepID=UPI001F43C623|nr:hypothetical protein [Frigidibacter mobilis]
MNMFFKAEPDWTARCEGLAAELVLLHGDKGLRPDNFGFVAYRESGAGQRPDGFAYRGDWRCYPCSLVKAFHLIHALNAIDAGRIIDHEDLSRAIRDMILWSSNTGTNYVIVSATTLPYAARLDGCLYRHGMRSSMPLCGWPSRIARRVAAI